MTPIFFAILAAIAFGSWTVFHKLASPHINQTLGAILVSVFAVIFGSVYFFLTSKQISFSIDAKGYVFIVLAGVSAFLLDLFALQAYSKGLTISVGGPIIIGGSIAIATIAGFLMGDSITALKVFGLLLLMSGAVLLASVG